MADDFGCAMGYGNQTDLGGSREAFLTTQWTLIEGIKADEDRDQRLIGFLLEQYWKPVYCFLRRKGHENEAAKDLTQGFFHEVVLNRDLVKRADQARPGAGSAPFSCMPWNSFSPGRT